MTKCLAILAGQGDLPQMLAQNNPDALFVTFLGVDVSVPDGIKHYRASFEKLGQLFDVLKQSGVTDLVFAGAMARPALDPAKFDAKMITLAPRLMEIMARGDDALFRGIAEIFEAEGFSIKAAHAIQPDLLLPAGNHFGPEPSSLDQIDQARALEVLAALSPLDISQAVVVAGGQVLGIETIQGTDAMLNYVATTPQHLLRKKAIMLKGPKKGQDIRFDVPTIGKDTVYAAAAAGLAGIYILAGWVNVLHRDQVELAIKETGLFLRAL
ncbi:MAG TPA: DUF1009 domain-containing protein [Rhodobacteraceae bacterium]|jgi:DUF1009 family protein|nr:DUF1009 domain-containing protein [Paracoccaceae bacterium]